MKIFFASDLHLGVDARLTTAERERLFVRWLDEVVAPEADALYLLGDIFEFWFEYRSVVPRGHVRILGKLAELRDGGLDIQYWTGNHDLWMRDYFPNELGIPLHRGPVRRTIDSHEFLIAHGDGLGPKDIGYKRMKRVFTNPLAHWAYGQLHPNVATSLARRISGVSRKHTDPDEVGFMGADKEWLVAYAERKLQLDPSLDYCVFGHRHLPIDYTLANGHSRYINLGDWLNFQTYAKWDGHHLQLHAFDSERVVYPLK